MAKYEKRLKGNFDDLLNWLHQDITNGSISVSYEDGSSITVNNTRMAVRVYERYSMTGSNRVSMNVTLLGVGDDLFVTAITSGGSQAVFLRLMLGEEAFLRLFIDSIESFVTRN